MASRPTSIQTDFKSNSKQQRLNLALAVLPVFYTSESVLVTLKLWPLARQTAFKVSKVASLPVADIKLSNCRRSARLMNIPCAPIVAYGDTSSTCYPHFEVITTPP